MKSWDELSRWMELLPDKRDVNSYSFSRMWGPRRQPRPEPRYADLVILAFSIPNCRKLEFYYLNLYSRIFFYSFSKWWRQNLFSLCDFEVKIMTLRKFMKWIYVFYLVWDTGNFKGHLKLVIVGDYVHVE